MHEQHLKRLTIRFTGVTTFQQNIFMLWESVGERLNTCVFRSIRPQIAVRLCAVHRTGPFSRTGVSGAPRRAGTAVRNGSDSDVIYYLNRTRLPVIGAES